ncbi:MAG TPA: ABC transporter permease, partial [Thermomicrobiales bacterium]|nr:ABC transporter permease [Thermomicrobiales bacterium]
MARYILGRLLGLLFVLLAVSAITFFLTRLVPGDPFAAGERRLPEATQAARAAKYGFDQPIWRQYLNYIGSAVRGDFGVPFQAPTSTVVDLIRDTWPVTLRIGLLTILISYPLGILLGFVAAVRRNSFLDYFLTFGSTLGLVLPPFVVALWLILLFSVRLDW